MKNIFNMRQRKCHGEITGRMDTIIGLLSAIRDERKRFPVIPTGDSKYLISSEVCEMLRISKRTLARYRQNKTIRYFIVNGRVRYKAADIENYMRCKSTDADTPLQESGSTESSGGIDVRPEYYLAGQVRDLLNLTGAELKEYRRKKLIRYELASKTRARYDVNDVNSLIGQRKRKADSGQDRPTK